MVAGNRGEAGNPGTLPMYKMLNQIESTADLGHVLFIDFMTSPQARSSARDDKEGAAVE